MVGLCFQKRTVGFQLLRIHNGFGFCFGRVFQNILPAVALQFTERAEQVGRCFRQLSAGQFVCDRLRTRFEGGLLADVQPPDVETRMAIIRNKAAQFGMMLSDDVVKYIAENITSNVRQLEGVVKRLTAYRDALQQGDRDGMRALLREGREVKERLEES